MSYFQFTVLTPCPAGPLNVSFHTCVHSAPMILAVVTTGWGRGARWRLDEPPRCAAGSPPAG